MFKVAGIDISTKATYAIVKVSQYIFKQSCAFLYAKTIYSNMQIC